MIVCMRFIIQSVSQSERFASWNRTNDNDCKYGVEIVQQSSNFTQTVFWVLHIGYNVMQLLMDSDW